MEVIKKHLIPGAIAAVAFALCGAMSFDSHAAGPAAGSTASPAAQARYQAEVAKCNNGTSNQDRATCMKEAGAALTEKKRGTLTEGNPAYDQNAVARCNAMPAADQADCKARIQAPSAVEGSAQSGGVIRESVTRTVGEPVVVQPITPEPAK